MKPACYDGITEAVQHIGGGTRKVQVVYCTCADCTATLELPITGSSRKPPSAIFNIARRKDWSVNEGKRTFLCPTHARKH